MQYINRGRNLERHARTIHLLMKSIERRHGYVLFRLWDPGCEEMLAESTLPLDIIENMADWAYQTFTIGAQTDPNSPDDPPWHWVELDLTADEIRDLFHAWGPGLEEPVQTMIDRSLEPVRIADLVYGTDL